ncbi:MAG: PLP-dependent transferase [Oligoflexia bacterium]|nr:PLP-dependent transferase [Oligoflexia bacterium]
MSSGNNKNLSPETKVLHQGFDPNLSVGSIISPIYPNSTYVFPSAKAGARAFEIAFFPERATQGESAPLIYSRLNHPNAEILEDKLVQFEPGAGAAAVFCTGMSAIATSVLAVLALLPRGKKIVYSNPIYGGTDFFFKQSLAHFGHESITVETCNSEKTKKVLDSVGEQLGILFIETPANPTLAMSDIDGLASYAKKLAPDCTVIVDNTFMGIFQHPFKVSTAVDVIVYSATKFMSGHAHLLSGVALVRGERKELMTAIKTWRTTIGTIAAPNVCWELENAIKTYTIRMRGQAARAQRVAHFLSKHPKVALVRYPTLLTESDPDFHIYKKQCSGPGSIITVDLKNPTREHAFQFLDTVSRENIISLAVSLGGVESLVEHPATMTHSEVSEEDRKIAKITDATIRFSIGLENSDDLIRIIKDTLDSI